MPRLQLWLLQNGLHSQVDATGAEPEAQAKQLPVTAYSALRLAGCL